VGPARVKVTAEQVGGEEFDRQYARFVEVYPATPTTGGAGGPAAADVPPAPARLTSPRAYDPAGRRWPLTFAAVGRSLGT